MKRVLLFLTTIASVNAEDRGSRPKNVTVEDYELDIFSVVSNIAETLAKDSSDSNPKLTNIVNIHVIKDRNSSHNTSMSSMLHNQQPVVAPYGCRVERMNWIIFSVTIISLLLNLFSLFIILGVYRVLPNNLRCYFPASETLHPQRETRI